MSQGTTRMNQSILNFTSNGNRRDHPSNDPIAQQHKRPRVETDPRIPSIVINTDDEAASDTLFASVSNTIALLYSCIAV